MAETTTLDQRTFHLLTLGCSKNRVDSDGMASLLSQRGMRPVADPDGADAIIVNTCGFLGAARDESVAAIEEMLQLRQTGQVVIAAGCMPALGDYSKAIPSGVDSILTTREWFKIGEVVGNLFGIAEVPEVAGCEGIATTFKRFDAGPSAYVKVADGCDHACAFCTIPSIKGRQVSKPPIQVLQEIVDLVAGGTREVVLVAQDTIRYGADLGMKHGLPQLLESIAEQVPNLDWLRLLYIYPSLPTLSMVDTLSKYPALLSYLDMPLQHADPAVLKRMNRPSDPVMTRRLIDHARATLPDLVMRTTFIVGYPGETEQEFVALRKLIENEQFDHVGVFTFSPEKDTKATALPDHVPAEIAEERRGILMEIQQGISYRKNRALVGSTMPVLIEAVGEAEDEEGNLEPISLGRAWRHAPEVDGMIFVSGSNPVGEMVECVITDAAPYDLFAYPATESIAPERAMPERNRIKRRQRAGRALPVVAGT